MIRQGSPGGRRHRAVAARPFQAIDPSAGNSDASACWNKTAWIRLLRRRVVDVLHSRDRRFPPPPNYATTVVPVAASVEQGTTVLSNGVAGTTVTIQAAGAWCTGGSRTTAHRPAAPPADKRADLARRILEAVLARVGRTDTGQRALSALNRPGQPEPRWIRAYAIASPSRWWRDGEARE